MRHPVTCSILAGGASVRLGRNKALLSLRGRSLLELQLAVLRPLFDRIVIGANDPLPYVGFGHQVVPDVLSQRCALAGIHAAISAAVTEHCFVVACDLPFLDAGLIERLLRHRPGADAVVPLSNRGSEPLHAVYARSCLGPIEEAAARGDWWTGGFHDRVHVIRPRVFESGRSPFFNLNTPDDLRGLDV